jgi:hypothetical protein
MHYNFSKHALMQMAIRGIEQEAALLTVNNADQQIDEDSLTVFQRIFIRNGQPHLLRVFVNLDKEPPLIVTCYLTTKITKYYESEI